MPDMFDQIIGEARRIVGASTAIASDVFPKGATLTCARCGHEQAATTSQCARYLTTGWPEHCGYTMKATRV
jgi:hypothetical protein